MPSVFTRGGSRISRIPGGAIWHNLCGKLNESEKNGLGRVWFLTP